MKNPEEKMKGTEETFNLPEAKVKVPRTLLKCGLPCHIL